MSQKNGSDYIIIYQMLCLTTANNNGSLSTKIGDVIVPYDINKIVRDTKYFDFDTVTVALELFKKLGLIFYSKNQILNIKDFEEMVGKEGASAKRVRDFRAKNKALQCNTKSNTKGNDECLSNVTQDKEIDNREKIIEKDIEEDKEMNTINCHLNFNEKYESCLNCFKLKKCDKKTNEIFLKKYKVNVEDYNVHSNEKNNDYWNGKKIEEIKCSETEEEELKELLKEFRNDEKDIKNYGL